MCVCVLLNDEMLVYRSESRENILWLFSRMRSRPSERSAVSLNMAVGDEVILTNLTSSNAVQHTVTIVLCLFSST